jgi:hypothetical protein
MKRQFTRAEKNLIRAYALDRERATGKGVVKVRLLNSGDARAYCKDGHTYLIAPAAALFAEARRTFHKGSFAGHNNKCLPVALSQSNRTSKNNPTAGRKGVNELG